MNTQIGQEKNRDNSSAASSLWLSCNHPEMENALDIIKRHGVNATWVRPLSSAKKHSCPFQAIGYHFIEQLILRRHFEFVVVCGHLDCRYLHKDKLFKQEKGLAYSSNLNRVRSHQEAIIESKHFIVSKVQAISAIPLIANQIYDKNLQVIGCLFLQDRGVFVPCVPGQSDLEHPDF